MLATTDWRGATVCVRHAAMADAMASLLPFGDLLVGVQGSYRQSSSFSGGTHTGGGALDVGRFLADGRELTWDELGMVESAGRQVGGVIFRRERISGLWERHCHFLEKGCTDFASEAALQVQDYYACRDALLPRGNDGLAINADTGTRSYVDVTWETYAPATPPATPPVIDPQELTMADITAITAALADLKATVDGYGARVERIDEGAHGGWGYGRRIENIETMLAGYGKRVEDIEAQVAKLTPKA